MKLLFFISSLDFGGAEKVVSLLSNAFVKNHEVIIAKFNNNPSFFEIDKSVKIIDLDIYKNGVNFYSKFKKVHLIRNCIKDIKPDIIISFMDITNLSVIIAKIGLNYPLIITEHTHYSFIGKKASLLRRILYPLANFLVVLTKEDFDYFSFVKNKKVIYNPVDIKATNDNFKKLNQIIFVGRLEWVKGCDRFLKFLKFANFKDYEILVIGDGSQKQNLINLSKELNLDVKFLGKLSDLSEVYKSAKFIISTSRIEGLGNVLIEAIFYNIIRVSMRSSGGLELIKNGKNGIISDNFDELKELMLKAMNDEKFANYLIDNANKDRDKFKICNIVSEYEEIFKELV